MASDSTISGSNGWLFHTYLDAAGKWRWRLTAKNGLTVASSGESFDSLSNARRAARNVRDNAGKAGVD